MTAVFDVMFHFHGHEPVRKEWVKAMDGAVFASVDLGIGSGAYETTFQDPSAFAEYLRSVESAMAKATGNPKAHARHIGLSAWSAGYGAVLRILEQPLGRRVDTVILLDGLHAGYVDGHVNGQQIQSVVDFAQAAAHGKGFFFFSHSSIIPAGGTPRRRKLQTTSFWSVNGETQSLSTRNVVESSGLSSSRCTTGKTCTRVVIAANDKMDHCAHIGLYTEVLNLQVKPRWKSPRGRAK